MSLAIGDVAGPRSFVFLWCGSSDGLDNGRKCLSKWGFRRCEDICWIKTNLKKTAPVLADESLLVRTKVSQANLSLLLSCQNEVK